jgi:xanthine dehydrogenase YagS FAD-binding subunit
VRVAEQFSFVRARSLSEAIMHLGTRGSRIVAGGTDLAGSLHIDGQRASRIVNIQDIDELKGISPTPDGGLRIGALTTVAEVCGSEEVQSRYAALSRAAQAAGRPDLRVRATIGGNLCQRPRCWYLRSESVCVRKGGDICFAVDGDNRQHGIFGGGNCHMVHASDVAPSLVALDARVRIVGPSGMRVLPIEEFFVPPTVDPMRENVLGPAEILTDVLLPPAPAGWASTYRRASEERTEYALASVAASVLTVDMRIAQVSVVLGAAAPVPWRSREAESELIGRVATRRIVEEAAETAMADAMPLADNRYKIALFRPLLIDALEEVAGLRSPA